VIIFGRLVLLALFILAIYLPVRIWSRSRGYSRFLCVLPVLPIVGMFGYAGEHMFSDTAGEGLSPELLLLVLISSLLISAGVGLYLTKTGKMSDS